MLRKRKNRGSGREKKETDKESISSDPLPLSTKCSIAGSSRDKFAISIKKKDHKNANHKMLPLYVYNEEPVLPSYPSFLHHGTFENIHGDIDYRDGETTVWDNCDIDRWSFFAMKDGLAEMGHTGNYDMWFAQPNVRLEDTLKPIVDDRGAMKMGQIGLTVGIMDLYLLHTQFEFTEILHLPSNEPPPPKSRGEGDTDDGDEDSDGGDDTDDGDEDSDDENEPPPPPEPHTVRLSDDEYVANEGEATEDEGDEGHEDDEADQSGSDYDSDDDTDADSAADIRFNDSEQEDVEKDFFESVDGPQEQRTKRRMDKASVQPEADSAVGTQERGREVTCLWCFDKMDKPIVQPEPDSAFGAHDSDEDNVAVPTSLSSSKVRGLSDDEYQSKELGSLKLAIVNAPTVQDVESGGPVVKFQRLYFCLDACKKSFLTCRKIIGLDGCFLKGGHGCQLLSAVGRDPNDQMLPLAFAVVETVERSFAAKEGPAAPTVLRPKTTPRKKTKPPPSQLHLSGFSLCQSHIPLLLCQIHN
ncbi:putative MULE transposase domain-containing protein [Senna tora]|uniref:Putative MULE transposase domain-containing protein n=1 Tax=Senna tora TaxID=362788 RepID=A0A834X0F3_9FABA|nr:putative MULE transposase domain-containing protein [Senna tora]